MIRTGRAFVPVIGWAARSAISLRSLGLVDRLSLDNRLRHQRMQQLDRPDREQVAIDHGHISPHPHLQDPHFILLERRIGRARREGVKGLVESQFLVGMPSVGRRPLLVLCVIAAYKP